MVKEKPLPGGKKNRKNASLASKSDFTPTKIEINDPLSLILLLESKETVVLVQVLSSLMHYASNSEECSSVLVDGGVLPHLVPLLHHEDQCCQRYAFRLISCLVFHKKAKTLILQDKISLFTSFLDSLINTTDIVIQENASKIISTLCTDEVACAYLNDSCSLDTLGKCLLNGDPDVQKNVLEIMVKYLQDPSAKPSKEFNLQPLLQLTMSEYPEIQNLVFDIIILLTDRQKDNNLMETFKNAGGVGKLMPLLERFDWSDLHLKVLQIISNLAEAQNELECLKPNDIRLLVTYVTKAVDVKNLEQAWIAIIKMAELPSGRKALKELQILEKMAPMLRTESEHLPLTACIGFIKFMQDFDTMEEIVVLNPLPALLSLLRHNHKWKTKEAAISTIKEGLKRHTGFHQEVSEKYLLLQNILELPSSEVPAEVDKGIIECLTLLAQTESFRCRLEPSLIQIVVKVLQESDEDALRTAAFNLLNVLMLEEKHCNELKENYLNIIWKNITLHSFSYPTTLAAAHFVEIASKNNYSVAKAFIEAGALHWMIQNKELHRNATWIKCIDILFSNHLSAKFAYKGHLSYTDIIKNQFYTRKQGLSIEKQQLEKFPSYDEILKIGHDKSQKPIYLINIQSDIDSEKIETSSSQKLEVKKKLSIVLSKTNDINISKSSQDSDTLSHPAFSNDECLLKYIEQVRKLLEAEDQLQLKTIGGSISALSSSDTEIRVKIIGKYVGDQLSGPDPKVPCTTHYLNLHLEQLKEELGSSLIPIGLLRAGLAMERALLFKVLADQVGLPCALVRGQCSQVWVEVSLPILPSPPTPCLPINLLKPTHIVDLLHTPVTLLPIGSFAANKYCTCPSLNAYNTLM